MFAWAGRAVAVANAHPEVLAAADEITASNEDDGVARSSWSGSSPTDDHLARVLVLPRSSGPAREPARSDGGPRRCARSRRVSAVGSSPVARCAGGAGRGRRAAGAGRPGTVARRGSATAVGPGDLCRLQRRRPPSWSLRRARTWTAAGGPIATPVSCASTEDRDAGGGARGPPRLRCAFGTRVLLPGDARAYIDRRRGRPGRAEFGDRLPDALARRVVAHEAGHRVQYEVTSRRWRRIGDRGQPGGREPADWPGRARLGLTRPGAARVRRPADFRAVYARDMATVSALGRRPAAAWRATTRWPRTARRRSGPPRSTAVRPAATWSPPAGWSAAR